MEGIIITLAFVAATFGVFYMHYTTRNRERLALIEKGADASMFRIGREQSERTSFGKVFNVLKVGLFLIGGGLGVVAGYLLDVAGMYPGASYTSMILMLAGLGLVVYYLIARRQEK
ncbi:MAG: DUF6249 domain-containing protein [Marinilabiliaceae bacterium]|nr:DUF6249 domain-containing protein [Marinilabiliaceae bacterium]